MSTHNIGFYEEISKYHQICTLFLLLSSTVLPLIGTHNQSFEELTEIFLQLSLTLNALD